MSLKRNAQQNVECSINELRKIESHLSDAVQTVENPATKEKIQSELSNVQNSIGSMESINSTLKTDRYPGNR